MAKNPTNVEDMELEVEETEELEDDEVEVMTPKALAEELDISPKSLRSFLRREFPRTSTEKNTSWKLSEAQVEAARVHFLEEDDADEDEVESDED